MVQRTDITTINDIDMVTYFQIHRDIKSVYPETSGTLTDSIGPESRTTRQGEQLRRLCPKLLTRVENLSQCQTEPL